jgi:TolA-binding protein
VDVHSLQAPAAIDLSLDDETRAVLLVHDNAEAEARVAANPRKSRATAAASEAEAGTTESDKHSTLLEELALIRGASQALRAGEPARARALLAEHRERFPKSVLATERRGLSLLTTCSEGTSASTRAAAKQFLKAAPNSPLAVHVKKECLD